jgi:phytoene synthase
MGSEGISKMKYTLEQAYAYCHKAAKKADSNFYLGFMFLPKPKRDAFFACYAFFRYVDDIADEYKGEKDYVTKLIQRWETDLDRAYLGEADHPIMIALAHAVKSYNIPKAPFKGLILGCKMDQTIRRYETFDDLLKYCELVASTISTVSISIIGCKDKKAFEYGRYLGLAFQLTNIIRDIAVDAKKGRIYLPLDELQRFEYGESDLLNGVVDERYVNLMRFQVKRAREYYMKAKHLMEYVDTDCKLATSLAGAAYLKILDGIEKKKFDVYKNKFSLSGYDKSMLVLKNMIKSEYSV